MENEIARAVERYDSGRMTRRELVTHLAALAVVLGAAGRSSTSAADSSTFEGLGLNHIALRVTDVPRSRDFYVKHLAGLGADPRSSSTRTRSSKRCNPVRSAPIGTTTTTTRTKRKARTTTPTERK